MEERVITKKNCSITFSQKGMTIQLQNRKRRLVYLILITSTIITAILLFMNKYFFLGKVKYNLLEVINIILVVITIWYKTLPKRELIPYHFIEKITIMNSIRCLKFCIKIDPSCMYHVVLIINRMR